MTYFEVVVYLLGGAVAGAVNGLLGIGCGVVVVPLLISMQWEVGPAIGTAHIGVFLSSAASTYFHRRKGFSWPKVASIAIPAVVTSQLATAAAADLPPQAILLGFSGLMFMDLDVISAATARRDELGDHAESPPLEKVFFSYIFIGLVTGVVAAVFGLGGGLVIVPLLLIMTSEPPKQAVRTSLAVMMSTSLAATLPHVGSGTLNYAVGFLIGATTIIGGLAGSALLPYVPDWALRKLISICVLVAGIHMYIFGMTW